MDEQWKVILYRNLSGDYPIQQFINGLEVKARSKIKDAIKMLQEFGISLGPPHVKKLTGTNLWELRIIGGDSVRILYVAMTGKIFVLLHGFKKKRDKTPPKEIQIAKNRLAELRTRIKLED